MIHARSVRVDGTSASVLIGGGNVGQETGWCFDDNTAPTKILPRPGACAPVQPDTKGKVEVIAMCGEQPR
jgi:hypothetical protein